MNLNIFLQTAPLFRVFLMLMAGIVSGEYLFNNISPAVILLTLLVVLFLSPLLRKSGNVQSAMLFFIVYLMGICLYRTSIVKTEIAEKGYYNYYAVVTSNVKHNKGFSSFDIIKVSGERHHKLKATIKGNIELNAGDRLQIRSKITPPKDKHIDHFSYASYLKRNGYAGTTFLDVSNIRFAGNYNKDLSMWTRVKIKLLNMRNRLLSKLHEHGLSGRDFATVSAMAFGDKTYLSSADKDMYSKTGVSHVLALSGLHIGIIYTFLAFFLTYIPKIPKFLITLCTIWFYVVFAGMSPSLIRAALMITVYSIGMLMHREKISINSLSIAGTISLLISPQTIFDLCFQLSFLSVFSIILFYEPLTKILPSKPLAIKKITQMIAVSLAAYIGTMPIILYNFGNISLCFLITNLFVVPLTTIVIYLAILSLIPLIGNYIIIALAFVIHLLNLIINKISDFKFASIDNVYISLSTVVLIYIIILSLYFIYCKLHSNIKT